MGLILNFEICQSSDCTELTFVETTGAYAVTTNENGWGTPNPATAYATSAILTIELSSGNTYSIDLFATGNFPTDDTTFEYLITSSVIGGASGSAIADQIIKFTYTVVDGKGDEYHQVISQAFYCQAQCCVMSMFANLDLDCDGCNEDKMNKALKAYALLKGLIYSANCGNSTYFNNILTQVNKLCLNTNCQNCK